MFLEKTVNKKIASETLWKKIKKQKFLLLLLMPSVIFVLVFQYASFFGITMAFQDFDIFKGITGSEFVGFKNFETIFKNPKFLLAIKNTLIYGGVIVFLGFPFPVILALMFNELKNMAFKKTMQTISYLPYFLSWVSVTALFYSFFSMEGTFNAMRSAITGKEITENILMNSDNFLSIMFVSHLWKNIGWSSVLFLAAITGVDLSLYDAAKVDGCNKFGQIWHVTLPGIMPTMVIAFIMSLSGLVTTSFEQVYGLQNLYTQADTEVINTLVYRLGIMDGDYATSTAFGLAQGLVSVTLIFTGNLISKKIFKMGVF